MRRVQHKAKRSQDRFQHDVLVLKTMWNVAQRVRRQASARNRDHVGNDIDKRCDISTLTSVRDLRQCQSSDSDCGGEIQRCSWAWASDYEFDVQYVA